MDLQTHRDAQTHNATTRNPLLPPNAHTRPRHNTHTETQQTRTSAQAQAQGHITRRLHAHTPHATRRPATPSSTLVPSCLVFVATWQRGGGRRVCRVPRAYLYFGSFGLWLRGVRFAPEISSHLSPFPRPLMPLYRIFQPDWPPASQFGREPLHRGSRHGRSSSRRPRPPTLGRTCR